MVQIPSWEANWFAASQEIPRISRNPKVHYRTHKRTPPVSILGQPNPVHIPTSHLLEIHPNIIHPSTPRSPQWSPSLRFLHQDPIHLPLLTHTRHMPSPSHSSRYWVRSTDHLAPRYAISSSFQHTEGLINLQHLSKFNSHKINLFIFQPIRIKSSSWLNVTLQYDPQLTFHNA